MIRKLFFGKLFILYLSALILGFFIGYNYSLMTIKEYDASSAAGARQAVTENKADVYGDETNQFR